MQLSHHAHSTLIVHSLLCILLSSSACGVIKKKKEPDADTMALVGKPLPPEKAKAVLSEVGSNFAYGPGLGDTALSVGTVVVFPPYALYLLGNAVLSLSGYEPVTVSSLLPEREGKEWSSMYDSVVSVPGKVVAAAAGREFRSPDVAQARMKTLVHSIHAAGE
jgi:hypothetical protein